MGIGWGGGGGDGRLGRRGRGRGEQGRRKRGDKKGMAACDQLLQYVLRERGQHTLLGLGTMRDL